MRGELVPARRRTRSSRPRARFGVSSSGAGVRDARVLIATPSRPRGSASALTPACSGALVAGIAGSAVTRSTAGRRSPAVEAHWTKLRAAPRIV